MITVISGEPGNGKTAYVVSELVKEAENGRTILVFGIPDLKVAHVRTPPVAEWTELVPHEDDPSIMVPRFTFPHGALVVIDEAQDVYKPRAPTSKVPPIAAALERHRHLGLDIWLITQKPMLLDSHVRQEAGRHLHITSTWKGRELLEWPSVRNPGDRAEVARAITVPYKLPTHVYDLYKSASLHVKARRRIPRQLYYFVFSLVGAVIAIGFVVWRINDRVTSSDEEPTNTVEPARGATGDAERRRGLGAGELREANQQGRLISYVYASVGGAVRARYWTAELSEGKRVRVDGERCAGEGRDAVCTYQNVELRF